MWVMFNDAFLSIVDKDAAYHGGSGPCGQHLTVRARVRGDIEKVFPAAMVKEGGGTDYAFRAIIHREVVAQALADRVMGLGYSNFKGSVADKDRHDTYMKIWDVMFAWQGRLFRKVAVASRKRTPLGNKELPF